ncbi:MAG: hypothetical protein WC356_05005 [Candidatus Micrarchaeia archaeon]|jgi:transposase-like protein
MTMVDWVCCPSCGSNRAQHNGGEEWKGDKRIIPYQCLTCGKQWNETWQRKIVLEYTGVEYPPTPDGAQ